MVDDAHAAEVARTERRRLQERAYGRTSDEADRRAALDALAALEPEQPTPPAQVVAPGSARDPMSVRLDRGETPSLVLTDSGATGDSSSETSPDASGDVETASPRAAARNRRRRLAIVLAIVVIAAIALLAGRSFFSASNDVYSRDQVASDRSIPEWLTNAFGLAGARMADPELAARLTDSVRRVEDGGLVGYVFRDDDSGTVCLAGSQGIDCAGTADYPGDGLVLTMIDPRDPAEHALRYQLLPDSGFRGEVIDLDRPAGLQQMDPARWPQLITTCLADRGFPATADPGGDISITPAEDSGRELQRQMAYIHCSNRYPLKGQYLDVEP